MTKIPSALWPSTDIPAPGPRHVLTQIAHFFDQLGYEDSFRALVTEAKKKDIIIDIAEWERGITEEHSAPLLELWEEWYRQNGGFPMLPGPSPDRPSKKSRVTAHNARNESRSDSDSDSESESDGDSSDEMKGNGGDKTKTKAVKAGEKRKRKEESSSSSNESSSDDELSNDDSSSEDDDSEQDGKREDNKREAHATSKCNERPKCGSELTASDNKSSGASGPKRKRVVTPPSSSEGSSDEETDDSSSDDSSSSDSDAPPAKKSRQSRRSDSSSEHSSDESSSDASSASDSNDSSDASSSDDPVSNSDSDSSSDSDSDDSSSDSSISPPPKKKAKLDNSEQEPERGSTSSATLDHEPNLRAPVSGKNKHQKAPSTKKSEPVSTVENLPVTSRGKDSPNGGSNNAGDSMHPDRLRRMPVNHEGDERPKKGNVPFSRIPKDQKVDPRFASNDYVPYDYANRAYQDLSVTRGKGFTKEKNKKKRGKFALQPSPPAGKKSMSCKEVQKSE